MICMLTIINPLSANPTKWPKTLKTICRLLPPKCLSVFDHFVELAFKGLRYFLKSGVISLILLTL